MSKSAPRHQARRTAFQILYQADIESHGNYKNISAQDFMREVENHFAHFDIPEKQRDFTRVLVTGTLAYCPELDSEITPFLKDWKFDRLNPVDRALLRLGTFELKYQPETPTSVVVDEAIELAKEFGTKESGAFINGILDAARKSIRQT